MGEMIFPFITEITQPIVIGRLIGIMGYLKVARFAFGYVNFYSHYYHAEKLYCMYKSKVVVPSLLVALAVNL